jgi:hypothetical protein
MATQVYSFVINSADKIAGSNNLATYNLMFSILPREYSYYKVAFSFMSDPAFFVDTWDTVGNNTITYSSECGRILTNLLLQNSVKTDNSPSNLLGIFNRSYSTQNTTTSNHICYMTAGDIQNQEIVVLRPDVDQITISVLAGTGNTPLVSTNSTGTLNGDCPNYIIALQFTPVKYFHVS